jgi:hypothetical protein
MGAVPVIAAPYEWPRPVLVVVKKNIEKRSHLNGQKLDLWLSISSPSTLKFQSIAASDDGAKDLTIKRERLGESAVRPLREEVASVITTVICAVRVAR